MGSSGAVAASGRFQNESSAKKCPQAGGKIGEDVFIAVEGDIVDRRYKVIHIGPTSVEVEDVLYNNRQSIPLTQGPQG